MNAWMTPRRRDGFTLLETLVAMVILAIAGFTLIAGSRDALALVTHAADRDAESRRASALLDAASIWTRTELDQRLGERPQGPWVLRIQRPLPTLYELTLLNRQGAVLLRTSLYRTIANAQS